VCAGASERNKLKIMSQQTKDGGGDDKSINKCKPDVPVSLCVCVVCVYVSMCICVCVYKCVFENETYCAGIINRLYYSLFALNNVQSNGICSKTNVTK